MQRRQCTLIQGPPCPVYCTQDHYGIYVSTKISTVLPNHLWQLVFFKFIYVIICSTLRTPSYLFLWVFFIFYFLRTVMLAGAGLIIFLFRWISHVKKADCVMHMVLFDLRILTKQMSIVSSRQKQVWPSEVNSDFSLRQKQFWPSEVKPAFFQTSVFL